KTALVAPNAMVVTRDFAKKYFGEEEALGQTLKFDNQNEYLITGVLANVPANSHFTFDFLVSMATYANPRRDNWEWLQFYTYLLLEEKASPQAVAEKFPQLLRAHVEETIAANYSPYLQPLTDIHLRSQLFREMQPNSDLAYLYLFSAVAGFILLIACINFMNLTTARATTRAKEVGVRKATGADRVHLVKQFLGEAVLTSLAALLLAVMLMEFLLPVFNRLAGRRLALNYFSEVQFTLSLLGIALLVGLLAGSYPALVLSNFKPAHALKGKLQRASGAALRKGLVAFQFAISAFLMIATGIVYHQLEYMQNKKLGFNAEQLLTIPIRDEAVRAKYETVKHELAQHPNVVSVAASSNLPGGGDWGIPYVPEGFPHDQIPPMRVLAVDHDFITTFGMELSAGRTFSKEHPTDVTSAYLINAEAAQQLGWDDPIGKKIAMPNIQREPGPVVGVVKDFHLRSLHEKIGPILFFIPPPDWFAVFSVRIRPQNVSETLAFLERKFVELDPAHPFEAAFFEERFAQLHQAEQRLGELLRYVAMLAIGVACLGLFGLAAFTAEQRTKEIGVRKVLGASVRSIFMLLSQDFTKLVLAGFVVAVPPAYFVMNLWLQGFAYRITPSFGVFGMVGVLTLAIAWFTVSYQALKAAAANPVAALRNE
ncbi:ABC transporter permease, partial [candidate division KSB1 bacterium]|nr:ABC transporter permease [candidate division KSB1 bacterium]